jgi:hypothetical protein
MIIIIIGCKRAEDQLFLSKDDSLPIPQEHATSCQGFANCNSWMPPKTNWFVEAPDRIWTPSYSRWDQHFTHLSPYSWRFAISSNFIHNTCSVQEMPKNEEALLKTLTQIEEVSNKIAAMNKLFWLLARPLAQPHGALGGAVSGYDSSSDC